MKQLTFLTFVLISMFSRSQDQLETVDVFSYRVYLEVWEEHDTILVDEQITMELRQKVDSIYLDLRSLKAGKGMLVTKVEVRASGDQKPVNYSHSTNKLWISTKDIEVEEDFTVELRFSGIPETGLIIGENKFGKRTYFGDNWPNRAHHWFACIDHPSDKAKVDFFVIHPKKYKVIATGRLVQQGDKGGKNYTDYRSDFELPTKVMVVGIAEFDLKRIWHDHSGLFPMTAWVYEEDGENGFKDMEVAADVVNYFVKTIARYPFEKLDHVQSTTQFGGMENAGNIFYDENAVTGKGTMEALIAHEVAHQWFGNSASESDWQHLWLSEGFATYFTDLYWEDKYGTDAMNERLITERNRVIRFSKQYDHPTVDTTYQSLMDLLNPNSYQKGAWFLHMLRTEIGDSAFWNGIRSYYDEYKYSNAATKDFQAVMEAESGKDLGVFFHQWLREALHPTLLINNGVKCGKNFLEINQKQTTHIFEFDLEVELLYEDGSSEMKTFSVSKRNERFKFKSQKKITGFKYDPNVKLLFEVVEN
jgi:aminopeptidase N